MVTQQRAESFSDSAALPSFLRVLRLDWADPNPTAAWLANDFYANEWRIRSGDDACVTLSWHRMMATGVHLTSDGYTSRSETSLPTALPSQPLSDRYDSRLDYRQALNHLKRIVFFYRHPRISRRCGPVHYCQFFQWIMTLTEWVFLQAERFRPQLNLFENVDTADLDHEFFPKWASGGKSELLELEARLVQALGQVLASIETDQRLAERIADTLKHFPGLATHADQTSPWLMFPPAQTARLRAWLHINGYFRAKGASRGRLAVQPLFRDLVYQDVKSDNLAPSLQMKLGTLNHADAPQQAVHASRQSREHPSVNIERLDELALAQTPALKIEFVDSSRLFTRKLSLLSARCEAGLPPPAVWSQVNFQPTLSLSLEPKGSTPTILPDIALHCLGMALRFVLLYGDDLVSYAISVKERLHVEQTRRQALDVARNVSYLDNLPSLSLRAGMPDSLEPLQIVQIHSIFRTRSEPEFDDHGGKVIAGSIRSRMGLIDALHLLEASMVVILGTTAARRQVELRKLGDDCLAKVMGEGWFIRFTLGKDVFGDSHGQLVRCIPNVAAKAIAQVRRLNQAWRSLHGASSNRLLFGISDRFDACRKATGRQINRRLDLFCDYIEVPLDDRGRRWYVRAHELRRFWAYSFFYKFGLGELHTIGWFLGHRESEQTWAYVRESFDGHDKEMRQIKAAYVASVLKGKHSASDENREAISSIRSLLLQHFGCGQIALVEDEELQAWIENVVAEGMLEIEPKFIRDDSGCDYEIIWIVHPKGDS